MLPATQQWNHLNRFDSPMQLGSGAAKRLFDPSRSPPRLDQYDALMIGETLQVAHLRSLYYYALHLVYRPLLFRALHAPQLMTEEDCEMAANSIDAALLWPIAMQPCVNWKRAIPCGFFWTHAFVEVLLLLRLISEHEVVIRICDNFIDEAKVKRTVAVLKRWIEDVSHVDAMAEWARPIVSALFPA